MPKNPPRKLRLVRARLISAKDVRETTAKLKQLRRIEKIIYEQECLRSVLAPDPTGDAARRVHAYGYRRILAVLDKL